MAIVNILISDQPGGLFIKLTSDEPMPKDDEDGGSIAQNAGLIRYQAALVVVGGFDGWFFE